MSVFVDDFFLVFSSVGNIVSASSNNYKEQEKMVEENFESVIKEAEGENKVNLKRDFEKFKKLPKDAKGKLIGYMFDQEITKTIIESLDEIKEGETKELLNGDIEVSMSSEDTPNEEFQTLSAISVAAATQYRRATYTKTVTFLGISILEVQGFVQYTHNGSKVIGTYGCDAYTNRNLNPTLSSSWGSCTRNNSTSQAWATARVTWSFIHKSIGVVYESHLLKVWGDYNNKSGGSVTKL